MSTTLAPSSIHVHGQWLTAARARLESGRKVVVITVVRALGSTPRDAGTRMWVDNDGPHETIGGGHLELQAISCAHEMLNNPAAPAAQVRHYALGPSLGQCCGGAVWLAFECLQESDLDWCTRAGQLLAAGQSVRRTQSVVHAGAPQLTNSTFLAAHTRGLQIESADASHSEPDAHWDENTGLLVDLTPASSPVVVVCGAGHVGKALVRVLAELPIRVVWIDPREEEWPDSIPDNVLCVNGDAQDVDDCPDDAYWLVLTHSHALDLEIIERVMRKKTFNYLGLIGSKTKRAKFRSRLLRQFSAELVDQMTCPIGIVETSSKLPGVIAVSVAAQIVGLLEQTTESLVHA